MIDSEPAWQGQNEKLDVLNNHVGLGQEILPGCPEPVRGSVEELAEHSTSKKEKDEKGEEKKKRDIDSEPFEERGFVFADEDQVKKDEQDREGEPDFLRKGRAEEGEGGPDPVEGFSGAMTQTALHEKKETQEIEEAGQAFVSLDNVGDRVDLDRMGDENKRRQKGEDVRPFVFRVKGLRAIGGPFRPVEMKQMPGDEEDEDAREKMEEDIEEVVAPHIESVEMVVDGKGEGREGPESSGLSDDALVNGLDIPQVTDRWILDDVWEVVEVERVVDGVEIKSERGQGNERNRKNRESLVAFHP